MVKKKTSAKISIQFSPISYELAFLLNPSTKLRDLLRDLSGDARHEMEMKSSVAPFGLTSR